MLFERLYGVIGMDSYDEFREIWDKLTSFIFANSPPFICEISNISKMNSINLFQIPLISMWFLVQRR